MGRSFLETNTINKTIRIQNQKLKPIQKEKVQTWGLEKQDVVNNDREWDFLYWDETDYEDEWVSDVPKTKEKGTTVED